MTVPPQQQLVVLVATSKGFQTNGTRHRTHGQGHTAHGTGMRPWLLLLLLSLDCRATATVSSMNLASGVRDAATRARFALVMRHFRKKRRSALAAAEQATVTEGATVVRRPSASPAALMALNPGIRLLPASRASVRPIFATSSWSPCYCCPWYWAGGIEQWTTAGTHTFEMCHRCVPAQMLCSWAHFSACRAHIPTLCSRNSAHSGPLLNQQT